ncbi:MAG TPA: hypothetical protein VFE04_08635 [Puia sp.]|nr:hypothetical protein [Puia sp.]
MKPAIYHRRLAAPAILMLLTLFTLNAPGQYLDNGGFASLRMNEVNSHAARHFLENFSSSTSVKWFQDEQHYIVTFQEGDSTDRAYYKNNGDFDFCIKYYRSDALEPYLRSVVLRKFLGCNILTVTEITDLERKELSIKIKDGKYIRTLNCSDGSIEITENIRDSNS